MKLKEKQGVILIFLNEPFKKKGRKSQGKQRNKNVWVVKTYLKNRADSNAYNNLLHMHILRLKISKNYSFSLNTRILYMNFQTIFLQTGFSSIKICLQNIHFLAIMCHSLYSVNFSRENGTFRWRMLSFQSQVSNKKLIKIKRLKSR